MFQLLLVEDDDTDAEAILRALQRHPSPPHYLVVRDGIEALEVLRGENGQARLPRPYIILLDLNMPRMDGIEFLQVLRQDPALMWSVVFILTVSSQPNTMRSAYQLGIAGYLLKTKLYEDMSKLFRLLDVYCELVELIADEGPAC